MLYILIEVLVLLFLTELEINRLNQEWVSSYNNEFQVLIQDFVSHWILYFFIIDDAFSFLRWDKTLMLLHSCWRVEQ